jgi:regulator of sigma E protease
MIVTILAFIVVLGITITVHEFGHFAMAKLLKIRVLVFSLGFGPRIAGFTKNGTEYRVAYLPLGGYVKMAGETPYDEPSGAEDEFLSHSKWHRFLVALAGPSMNIALAVLVMTATYMAGVEVYRYLNEPAVVGPVAADSIAARAGLRSGDRILSVDGNSVRTWQDMEIAIGTAPRGEVGFVIMRDGKQVDLQMPFPNTQTVDAATLGFKFTLPETVVALVEADSPAAAAGLKSGDQIVGVEGAGKSGTSYDEILNIVSESEGVPLNFQVLRKGQTGAAEGNELARKLTLTITPVRKEGRVVIGFYPEVPAKTVKHGLLGALAGSVRSNYEMSAITFRIIGRILTGSASLRAISGPIEIAQASGSAARTGSLRFFFGFIGMVSLQLGVFNLLPIPILDGGVIALLLVEGAIRRDLSLKFKEKIIQVGFVFLMLLMGFVVLNDLSKIFNLGNLFR